MFLANVSELPTLANPAVLERTRSSAVVRDNQLTKIEPVEWVELTNVPSTDRSTANLARVEQIRREIAAGTYLTDHKLDVVVGKLIDILHGSR